MTKQEAAQAYLCRDPVLYANLLEALRRGSAPRVMPRAATVTCVSSR